MPDETFEQQKPVSLDEQLRTTINSLNTLFGNVLAGMKNSREEVSFEKPIVFKERRRLFSMTERAVAGAFKTGVRQGKIVPIVSTERISGLYYVDNLIPPLKIREDEERSGRVVVLVYPTEFEEKCRQLRIDLTIPARQSIIRAVEADAQLSASGEERGAVKALIQDSFFRVYRGVVKRTN